MYELQCDGRVDEGPQDEEWDAVGRDEGVSFSVGGLSEWGAENKPHFLIILLKNYPINSSWLSY